MRRPCWSRSIAALPPPKGLTIELVREVSWSNVRDKLNLGLFDAAHLLSTGGRRVQPPASATCACQSSRRSI